MSFKLFLCKLGFHNWMYYKREVNSRDSDFHKRNTRTLEVRRCIKCEKIQESVFGYTWDGKFRIF